MGDNVGRTFLQRTLPMFFKESDFTKAYLSVFSDSDGKLGTRKLPLSFVTFYNHLLVACTLTYERIILQVK